MTRGEMVSRMSAEEFQHWIVLRRIESSEHAGLRAGAKPEQQPPPETPLWVRQAAAFAALVKGKQEKAETIKGAPLQADQ